MYALRVIVENGNLSLDEQDYYIDCITKMYPNIGIEEIRLDASGDRIQFRVLIQKRILTKMGGTLISDPTLWNSAKQAEFYETIPNSID